MFRFRILFLVVIAYLMCLTCFVKWTEIYGNKINILRLEFVTVQDPCFILMTIFCLSQMRIASRHERVVQFCRNDIFMNRTG